MRKDDLDRIEKWAATSLTLLLTLILCGPPAVAQSTTVNFHEFSAFALAQDFGFDRLAVTVNTGSTNGQKVTFLEYDHILSDPKTGFFLQETLGFGTIPNSAFQIQGNTDSLNVDTSTLSPDVFTQEICTLDPITLNLTCNPISGGVVTGTWVIIRNYETTQGGGSFIQRQNFFGGFTFVSSGTSESQAALASVNVLGATLTNIGQVGTAHNASIAISRH